MKYLWVAEPGVIGPMCRSRECAKAHYRDGEPKSRMTALHVEPTREYYLNWIYMCMRCKAVQPRWGEV